MKFCSFLEEMRNRGQEDRAWFQQLIRINWTPADVPNWKRRYFPE